MEKIKIDADKFLLSLLNQDDIKSGRLFDFESILPYINKALKEQDLEYKDGEIKKINPELTRYEEEIVMTIQDYELNKESGFTEIDSARKHARRIFNALKDLYKIELESTLPKWRKAFFAKERSGFYDTTPEGNHIICHDGYMIELKEIFNKLPKID